MLDLRTEAVLKVVFLTERCLNKTLFPEMYSMIETVLVHVQNFFLGGGGGKPCP